ncbi:HAD family hydrolase [Pelagicoccus mobilis]|uniref:HAD family hydrolase n=1 Tax=Pelagicoccus mobilis TaxID=415221 RepID=A0A934RXK8_9BACT|nr:HAD family hydrolase [Pelagicoccus mobilis]MBK1877079.1 HAD family hydrolase [Pelagicoccus mobilis]
MLFLDIDDTLVDHTRAERVAAELFGERFGDSIPDFDETSFPTYWHDLAEIHFAAFLAGETSFQGQRRRRMRKLFRDENLCDEKADELFSIYLKSYENSLGLFPDVLPFLEKHAGQGVGIISNGGHAQQSEKITRHGLDSYVSLLVTAESAGCSKPDAKIFHDSCAQAKVAPADAIYIGDSLEKDALGASKAGLRGIWLNRDQQPVPEGVESIQSLEEFE